MPKNKSWLKLDRNQLIEYAQRTYKYTPRQAASYADAILRYRSR